VHITEETPMKISQLMNRTLVGCRVHDDLSRAAQLLWEHDIGCVPVIDDAGHLAGILTDRDVCMAAYTRGLTLRNIPVTAVMTPHVFTCGGDDDVTTAERTMREQQIRRIPVVDPDRRVVGMISLSDIAQASMRGDLPPSEVASVLAVVSRPRTTPPMD